MSMEKSCPERQLPVDSSLLGVARFHDFIAERRTLFSDEIRRIVWSHPRVVVHRPTSSRKSLAHS